MAPKTPDETRSVAPLLPGRVRRVVGAVLGLLVVGAAYLIVVRGEALLQDLGSIAAYCF